MTHDEGERETPSHSRTPKKETFVPTRDHSDLLVVHGKVKVERETGTQRLGVGLFVGLDFGGNVVLQHFLCRVLGLYRYIDTNRHKKPDTHPPHGQSHRQ